MRFSLRPGVLGILALRVSGPGGFRGLGDGIQGAVAVDLFQEVVGQAEAVHRPVVIKVEVSLFGIL